MRIPRQTILLSSILVLSIAILNIVFFDHSTSLVEAQNNDKKFIFLPLITKPFVLIESEMVHVPSGEFQMGCYDITDLNADCGNNVPVHTVYLDAYNIDKYEVTNEQYAAFLNRRNSNDCSGSECIDLGDTDSRINYRNGQYMVDGGYDNHPVIQVTWYGAYTYCAETGARLPTEAEWEKAARGSNDRRQYPWGDRDSSSGDCTRANFYGDSGPCVGHTRPVGSYPAGSSPYGALDMIGNVWELVNDWYDQNYYFDSPTNNPPGPSAGIHKVVRGGGYNATFIFISVDTRGGWNPSDSQYYVGFRCAASP